MRPLFGWRLVKYEGNDEGALTCFLLWFGRWRLVLRVMVVVCVGCKAVGIERRDGKDGQREVEGRE